MPAVEAYYSDYNTYGNVAAVVGPPAVSAGVFTPAGLKAAYDAGLPTTGSKAVKITGSRRKLLHLGAGQDR